MKIYWCYIPETCLSPVLGLQPSKTRSFPIKSGVIWVPGVYINLYIYSTYCNVHKSYMYTSMWLVFPNDPGSILPKMASQHLKGNGSPSSVHQFSYVFIVFDHAHTHGTCTLRGSNHLLANPSALAAQNLLPHLREGRFLPTSLTRWSRKKIPMMRRSGGVSVIHCRLWCLPETRFLSAAFPKEVWRAARYWKTQFNPRKFDHFPRHTSDNRWLEHVRLTGRKRTATLWTTLPFAYQALTT